MGRTIALLMTLAATAALVGCGSKVEVVAASAPAKWEYHVERIENGVHQNEAALRKELEASTISHPGPEDLDKKLEAFNSTNGVLQVNSEQLNSLGKDGWEMCGSFVETETMQPLGGDMRAGNTRAGAVVMIFKRPAR